jgi:hypothetical protein
MGEHPQVHERPIAFSVAMVRALLAGRKTQTRRAIDPQPARVTGEGKAITCRYGLPGDRLWVRERFAYRAQLYDARAAPAGAVVYAADGDGNGNGDSDDHGAARYNAGRAWRPSRYMPRAASRILLEITGFRAERLTVISRADAIAEGLDASADDPVARFRELWDRLSAGGTFGWDANPWVWVIQFRVVAPVPPRRRAGQAPRAHV